VDGKRGRLIFKKGKCFFSLFRARGGKDGKGKKESKKTVVYKRRENEG